MWYRIRRWFRRYLTRDGRRLGRLLRETEAAAVRPVHERIRLTRRQRIARKGVARG